VGIFGLALLARKREPSAPDGKDLKRVDRWLGQWADWMWLETPLPMVSSMWAYNHRRSRQRRRSQTIFSTKLVDWTDGRMDGWTTITQSLHFKTTFISM
jgi:hypothetical protein